jgi:hypothetical protein
MKHLVLVAAHFAPSNLAAVHRARLWAQHLPEFGYRPIIVTTHQDYYEEPCDWDLHGLVAPELEVIRTRALPTRPVRVVGDIGVRGLGFHFAALARLAREGRMDLLHVTIPSNFSALLGRMVHDRFGTPYGIDYIDPWVHDWPGSERPLTKAWTSARLARVLEPWAVKHASLITGVAPGYFEPVLERNPHLREQAVTAAMPYGGSERDFEALRRTPRPTFLFDRSDGHFHLVYAGAMLPQARVVLDRLLAGLARLAEREPATAERLRMHFVGTGKSPTDPHGHNIQPQIEKYGLARLADEHPMRIGYVDVLNHLCQASATLIVGSTEAHYTPSKVFQAVQARRPVLALLHSESTAADFLIRSGAGTVIPLQAGQLPSVEAVATQLSAFVRDAAYDPARVDWAVFEALSARSSARRLAAAADAALARARR